MVAGTIVALLSVPIFIEAGQCRDLYPGGTGSEQYGSGSAQCSNARTGAVLLGMVTLVTGLGIGVWGLDAHESSKERARPSGTP